MRNTLGTNKQGWVYDHGHDQNQSEPARDVIMTMEPQTKTQAPSQNQALDIYHALAYFHNRNVELIQNLGELVGGSAALSQVLGNNKDDPSMVHHHDQAWKIAQDLSQIQTDHYELNKIIEQASSQAMTLFKALSANTDQTGPHYDEFMSLATSMENHPWGQSQNQHGNLNVASNFCAVFKQSEAQKLSYFLKPKNGVDDIDIILACSVLSCEYQDPFHSFKSGSSLFTVSVDVINGPEMQEVYEALESALNNPTVGDDIVLRDSAARTIINLVIAQNILDPTN